MFYGWKIVGVSIVGLALGYSAITIISFGVFVEPLVQEFGWSRSEVSLALTCALYTSVFAAPLTGFLVDRFGIRIPLTLSTLLFGLTLCSIYWLTPSLLHLYFCYAMLALLGAGTSPVTYAKALVQRFSRRRGLALGIGLAGVGIGAGLIPPVTQYVSSNFGWREAYLGLGVLVLCISLPITLLFFRNDPRDMGQYPDGDQSSSGDSSEPGRPAESLTGLSTREALRSYHYWLLAAIFFLLGVTLTGIVAHLIPMLVDRGVPPQQAASIAGTIGLTIIAGRIIARYLMDRFFAPYVTIAFVAGPAVGLILLALGGSGTLAVISAVFVGLAIGAEFDVMAFFTGRYIGQRCFGRVYGQIFAIFQLGCGFGPLLMATCYDMTGEYTIALWILTALTIVVCVLFLMFGKYPTLPGQPNTANEQQYLKPQDTAEAEARA